jgi:hypothetical protein
MTGLITGVQPIHFRPDAEVVISPRVATGDLAALPLETRDGMDGASSAPSAADRGER